MGRKTTTLARSLLAWYAREAKPLPWREDPGPYRAWVGEVMSQQTTLGVVVPRYEAFVRTLPHVQALARCPEPKLGRLWAGLGYYARARNLRRGAERIVKDMRGRLPTTYRRWLEIPGCGPYTAAMISSMCFGERVAAVDGNVVRVASRLLGMQDGVWEGKGQARIRGFVENHLAHAPAPGDLNQAFMELGQEICRRTSPACDRCPVRSRCRARARGAIALCPPPRPRRRPVDTSITVAIVQHPATGSILLGRRERGFLSDTVGFPLLDGATGLPGGWKVRSMDRTLRHTITHHRITARILVAGIGSGRKPGAARLGRILEISDPRWIRIEDAPSALSSTLDAKAYAAFRARRPG